MVVPVKIRSEAKSKMLIIMAVYDFYRLVLDVDSFVFKRNIL